MLSPGLNLMPEEMKEQCLDFVQSLNFQFPRGAMLRGGAGFAHARGAAPGQWPPVLVPVACCCGDSSGALACQERLRSHLKLWHHP